MQSRSTSLWKRRLFTVYPKLVSLHLKNSAKMGGVHCTKTTTPISDTPNTSTKMSWLQLRNRHHCDCSMIELMLVDGTNVQMWWTVVRDDDWCLPFRYAHTEIRTQLVVIYGPMHYQLDHGGAHVGQRRHYHGLVVVNNDDSDGGWW